MGVITNAGTTLRISATAPTAFDEEGYEAVFGATPAPPLVGEIVDHGSSGPVTALIPHEPCDSENVQKLKGNTNWGAVTLQMGLDNDDAGQVLMKAARASRLPYSFEITYQNGDKEYFQALVMSFEKTRSTVNTRISAQAVLEINATRLNPGIIESLAA